MTYALHLQIYRICKNLLSREIFSYYFVHITYYVVHSPLRLICFRELGLFWNVDLVSKWMIQFQNMLTYN
jgi:hypothetical protein